jgi:hypothetical protein
MHKRKAAGERLGTAFVYPHATSPKTPIQPCLPKLVPVQVVDQKVGRGVDADEQVGQPHDHDDGAVELAVAGDVVLALRTHQLVEVRDDFEALTYDKERRHSCKDLSQWLIFVHSIT